LPQVASLTARNSLGNIHDYLDEHPSGHPFARRDPLVDYDAELGLC
jgi:hypothetical protein